MSEFVEEFKIGNTNVKIADDYCRDDAGKRHCIIALKWLK